MRMVAVVLAGGSGQRFGAGVPKQLLELDGQTLLAHCVAAFDAAPGVDEVLVVMPPGRTADAEKLLRRRRLPQAHRGHRGRHLPARLDPGRDQRDQRQAHGGGRRRATATPTGACCSTTPPGRW